jgi:hypothetical protein
MCLSVRVPYSLVSSLLKQNHGHWHLRWSGKKSSGDSLEALFFFSPHPPLKSTSQFTSPRASSFPFIPFALSFA